MQRLAVSLILGTSLLWADVTVSLPQSIQSRPFSVRDSIGISYIVNPILWSVDSQRPSAPLISPDGKYFLLITQRGVLKTNSTESTIYLFTKTSLVRYLSQPSNVRPLPTAIVTLDASTDAPVISDVRWLEDSQRIAFLGRQGHEPPRLFIANVRNRSVTSMTKAGNYVTAYDVRGSTIAYTTFVNEVPQKPPSGLVSVTGQGGIWQLLYPDPSNPYDLDESELLSRASVLHIIRNGKDISMSFSENGIPLRLYAPAVFLSPDGRSLITTAPVRNIPEIWEEYTLGDTYTGSHLDVHTTWDASNPWQITQYVLVDLRTGRASPLIDAPTGGLGMFYYFFGLTKAVWSADGKRVVLSNSFLPLAGVSERERAQRANAPAVILLDIATHQFQPIAFVQHQGWPTSNRTRYLGGISWDEARKEIYFTYLMNPSYASIPGGEVYRLRNTVWVKETITSRAERQGIQNPFDLFVYQNLNQPPILAARTDPHKPMVPVWDPNPQLQHVSMGSASIYRWKANDGHPWSGILVLPPNYDPKGHYPLVIQTHGYDGKSFFADGIYTTGSGGRALAASGIVVLQMDELFDYMNTPREGPFQIDGFESAIRSLSKNGLIDPKRVGVIGFSYTEFYVLYALTHRPNLFAAASVTDGNDKSYYTYTMAVDIGGTDNPYLNGIEPTYRSQPYGKGLQNWAKDAPGFNLDKVQTPLLIAALERGELMGQWEIYAGLRVWQKPVDMVWVPSQRFVPHVLVKPQDRYMSQQSAVDWYRFWLQGYEDPDPAKAEQYTRWRHLRDLQQKQAAHQRS